MAGACRDSDSTRKAVAGRAAVAQRPRADRGVARTARSPVVAASLMALQRSAGNAAVRSLMAVPGRASGGPVAVVAQLLAEAGTTCPPAPVPPTPADPRADPKFTAVTGRVGNAAADLRKHPSGTAEAGKARDAAEPPANDKAGQAKAAQTDKMAEAKPKGFDKAGFIAAVNQAIAKAAPKNLDEADKFATSGKADGVKGEVMGKVTQGKEGSAKDVATATAQPPDPSVAKDKPVTPLAPASPASAPTVDGGQAMPGKAPAEQTDLRGGPCEVNSAMADAGVTDKHLTASNEPRMQQAAAAKGQAEAHAAQAPVQIRQKEDEALADAKASATTDAKAALAAMAGVKNAATGKAGAGKSAAKTAEETERARISGDINKIYDKTKSEVEAILTGLDAQVAKVFDTGEAAARREFTAKHKADMERYKDERYAGVTGAARWTADLFTGLPAEANQIFERAKAFYEQKMTMVISGVADIIGHELDTAKTKIATGRAEIRAYVANQPKNLQKLATQAANDINGKFDQLESDVDDKQNSLVEDLAQKYVEARTAVDEEIKAEQAKSQGLVDMVKNAVGESVRAILALKDMFMNLLSRAASAFTMILDAPVKFITNFMNAVKQGFVQFADNILTHLEKGLQSWLFGQLSASGIELPEKFDILGVLKMIASMLGLTWASIKARIIAADPFVGKVIDVVESKIEIFTKLATMGVAGVWEWIKEKVGDVKQMIFGQIKSFVVERVVKAGITWVLGMLNPAGALFKIVQALINVVQWIMERGAEMGEFIGTIIDAVMDIARGGGGGAPDKIEAALGKAVPLVLSFLASLLGLGGISTKVREFLDKGGELVMKGVDWVVKKALTMARPLVRALKVGAGWATKKFEAGKAWVKGKYEGLKSRVKGAVGAAKAKIRGGDDSVEGTQNRLELGVHAGVSAANKYAGKPVGQKVLNSLLGVIRRRHGLATLEPVRQGENWAVHGVLSRMTTPTDVKFAEVNKAEVRAAIARAEAAFLTARADHEQVVTKLLERGSASARDEANRVTVASDGVARRQQGGRTEGNLARGQRRGGDQEARRAAGQTWLEADAARWESGAVTRGRVTEMTRLTPEAGTELSNLRTRPDISDEERAAKIAEIMRKPSSYRYPARTREQREALFTTTDEYVPQRSSQDAGVPGATSSVHAEKLLRRATGAQAIGVSRDQCVDCQLWFRAAAVSSGNFIVVKDPQRVRVFMADQTMKGPTDFA